jgi:hypothetical protein
MSQDAAPSPSDAGRGVRIHPGSPPAPEGWLPARIEEISQGRIRLLVRQPLGLAHPVTVELSEQSAVLACVTQVEVREENDWAVTCMFIRELNDEELQPFGARRLRPDSADIRRWVRFPCETRAFYQVIGADPPNQGLAQVMNISAGGLGLHLAQPLETGKLLALELQGPHGQTPLPVLACVVYATCHADGEWAVGCTFIEELGENDLRGVV